MVIHHVALGAPKKDHIDNQNVKTNAFFDELFMIEIFNLTILTSEDIQFLKANLALVMGTWCPTFTYIYMK